MTRSATAGAEPVARAMATARWLSGMGTREFASAMCAPAIAAPLDGHQVGARLLPPALCSRSRTRLPVSPRPIPSRATSC